MTEANQQKVEVTEEVNKDAVITDLKTQLEALKAKTDELLNETKTAKQKAREAAEAAERERLEKARKDGDYKQLLESSEKERQTLAQQLKDFQERISTEKVRTESMKIAAELADGTNAELLSEFVARRIKYTDDGIKVMDSSGNLTVSTLDDLKKEFATSDKYKSLIRGTKASGGGATGAGSSAATVKQMDRGSFEKLTAAEKMSFIKSGGSLYDK